MNGKPIVFDLFCGLGGWSEAFVEQGYRAVGFDIEKHDYGNGCYPGELVLRDVRSVDGGELVKQYGIPACIVASPPCQEFSYMAMPWSKAKLKEREILANPSERARLTDLFNQCFRIQREISQAAGHYVPIVIENVRGAQKWVGKARWNFGSFYLWGDVPALMPITRPRTVMKDGIAHRPNGETNFHRISEAHRSKSPARGYGVVTEDGVKQFTPNGEPIGKNTLGRKHGSKSKARKAASAQIAKIPYALAEWMAKCFRPPVRYESDSP